MLEDWVPAMLAIGLPLLVASLMDVDRPVARALMLLPAIGWLLHYMAWRWTAPLRDGGVLQQAWAHGFLGLETLGALSSLLVCATLLRHADRSEQADRSIPHALRDAPVDVFICTYNEGREILERTILCATHIQHRDLRVWVLDDGARPWVRDLAEELGAFYLHRVKGRHAKAGNVNNGLRHALAIGRRPAFILLLDADFAAHRRILRRTLPLFAEPDVGVVQTPQHFFNPDPVQSGLLSAQAWPDEQRFFFNTLLPAKDAWGAAFCCGTSAVIRVQALLDSGGMATETVTEDMLTSFQMQEHGWRTVFLNERLSAGLAPEGLSEYVTQRCRWCLGIVQQGFTRWSPWGPARLTLAQRLSHFDSLLYWIGTFPYRVAVLAAPALFWWFGLRCFQGEDGDLLAYLVPAVGGIVVTMGVISRWRLMPVLSDVTQLLVTFPIMVTVAQALVKPFGRPFKVTPKGISRDTVTVQWGLLAPWAVMAALTAAGMAMHVSEWSSARTGHGYSLNMAWSLLNLFTFGIVIACCVELPRPRIEERFATDEPAQIMTGPGGWTGVRLRDLSTRGARIEIAGALPGAGSRGTLLLDGGALRIPFETTRQLPDGAAIRFLADDAIRRQLLLRLYTGGYVNEAEGVDLLPAVRGTLRRLLG
ncbi:glycosyltransferase [Falsiroseomonas sp. HW251]|uniref:glycosyltransferase n=1 Tax=Falsiroseomonas sp. HW251 TaxID=3390998 RepID=UPI003D323DC4